MIPAILVSLRTGRVRDLPRPAWDRHRERTWRTAYRKDEVEGPVHAGALGLEGDEQGNREVHGGPQMAVLAYAASHYPIWRREAGLEAMGPGAFGENFTLEGVDETSVCIGDAWEGDHAAFEVSQPRGPCANIARFWNVPDLLRRVSESGRVGWYLRVTREGAVTRGEALRLVARPQPEWPVARVFRLRKDPAGDPTGVRELSVLAPLSPGWRRHFTELAARLT